MNAQRIGMIVSFLTWIMIDCYAMVRMAETSSAIMRILAAAIVVVSGYALHVHGRELRDLNRREKPNHSR